MTWIQYLLPAAGGFLCGTIPAAYIITRLKTGRDIRSIGSGNVGTTNAIRAVGPFWGFVTLLVDVLKGAVPVLAVHFYLHGSPVMQVLAGAGAIAGHVFNPWLGFRGGKGVATSLGVFFTLAPAAMGIALVVFIIIIALFRYVSLGSLVAPGVLFGLVMGLDYPVATRILAAGAWVLIVIAHRANIRRLMQGTENRLDFSGKKD